MQLIVYTYCIILLFHRCRPIPEYEMNFITSSALKILDCDIVKFPPAIVAQRLMARMQYAATDSYRACIGEKTKRQIWQCKRFIKKDCPHQFDKPLNRSKLFKCYNHFHVQRNRAFGNLQTFKKHSKCMQDASAITQECTKALIESCEQRFVKSFKTIRMSMEMMEILIKQEPSLKIIHLVRDPRGILTSRFAIHFVSHLAEMTMEKEAKALCHRMLFDIDKYSQLKNKYPNNIVQLRYEDIATLPEASAKFLYQFTRGIAVPEQVISFIKNSTHAQNDNLQWNGTARKDSATTAYQWKTTLSAQNQSMISKTICKYVIEKLKYN